MSRSGFFRWKETPRPQDRTFLRPLCGARLTFLQDRRGLIHPGPRARQSGGSLPAMAEGSCADPPPQAAEAPKGQPWPSGGPILSAMPRPPTPGEVMEDLPGASLWARPWRAGVRWGQGGRARGSPPSRRFAGGGRVAVGSRLGRAGARAPRVRRTQTEAAPGPPGSPGAGRRRWGAGRKEATVPSSPRSLPELTWQFSSPSSCFLIIIFITL